MKNSPTLSPIIPPTNYFIRTKTQNDVIFAASKTEEAFKNLNSYWHIDSTFLRIKVKDQNNPHGIQFCLH